MLDARFGAGVRRVLQFRMMLLALLVVVFMSAMAAQAWATLEIQSYNDPAGDGTPMTYRLLQGNGQPVGQEIPDPFVLTEGEYRSFGPGPGTYIWKAVPPAGWKVADIQCANRNAADADPGEFAVDVANGQVTVIHSQGEDQYCAFTNRKIAASGGTGGGGGTGPGVAPTVPGGGAASASKAPALLRVRAGTHYARATIRILRASTIKGQLRWKGHVVGTARVKKTKAGTYTIQVKLSKKWQRTFKRQGRKKVTLGLKVTVVGNNKATKVFTSGVIVRI
jgi:hypothetical protein